MHKSSIKHKLWGAWFQVSGIFLDRSNRIHKILIFHLILSKKSQKQIKSVTNERKIGVGS
jgi:hypothetical protein